jgi:hypothetical protein
VARNGELRTSSTRLKGLADEQFSIKRTAEDKQYLIKRTVADEQCSIERTAEDEQYPIKRTVEDEQYSTRLKGLMDLLQSCAKGM